MSEEIRVTVFGQTDVGRVRGGNEDALAIADAGSGTLIEGDRSHTVNVAARPLLLAVADGMGGENAGEVASALALDELRVAVAAQSLSAASAAILGTAVLRTNERVAAAAHQPGRTGMGAALVAVLIVGSQAFVATVGDSRVYVLRDEQLVLVTRDQSLRQYLVDQGAISAKEARASPFANVLLQAIGRTSGLSVPVGHLSLRRGDVFVLCSDGLWSELEECDIAAIAGAGAPIDERARQLIEAANHHGGRDNVTVLLASIEGLGVPSPRESLRATFVEERFTEPPYAAVALAPVRRPRPE